MRAAADIASRIRRAALLRRAPVWAGGLLPWLALRSVAGAAVWSVWCAWDAFRLNREATAHWPRWLDDALPELEDSSALLLDAQTPVARLQRERLLARIDMALTGSAARAIASERVKPGLPWLCLSVLAAAALWLAASHPLATTAKVSGMRAALPQAVPPRQQLVLKVVPPAYTGIASSEGAPRDLQVPESSQVQWCEKGGSPLDAPVELSSGQSLPAGQPCVRWTASESVFWRWKGTRYNLKVTLDQPPEIVIGAPAEMVHELREGAQTAAMAVSVRDDYRVQRATVHMTLARGSGENIRFSDREMPLPESPDPRKRDWSKTWALKDLGMEPGDELYFFVRATDNAAKPHSVQSPTYTLRLPAPKQEADTESAALPTLVKPESLRSQRQIIIDTEQLIADMRARHMDAETVRERSQTIASDQGALRRRYGQFLGEESTLFGGDDHDDDQPGAKKDVLHEFGHAHDQAENATLFDDATKKVLRRALSAMWDAEKALRAISPKTALPPEYKALDAVKELQQADRIYLHKTAFAPPPIKEDKRMTGDMAGSASSKRVQDEARGKVPQQLRELVQALSTDGPLPALWTRTAQDWVRERITVEEQRLAAQQAIQDVADGCAPCRANLRAYLRGGIGAPQLLLQAKPTVDTPFTRAWRAEEKK
ncbi:DUF4175 domain-containing protein [Massilia solisilvae]|uniref:DUF4175 domain-containing protein n=1 Tax=Massilia solisilvae TaxID=1811225 RepID=A0ABT2BQT3_9BURK|nr:DUF4175 domain-containing protein [Massilia solisilvae]MCS0610820.1 DUF4175 domain-containing protein [Massilia solisilvae]